MTTSNRLVRRVVIEGAERVTIGVGDAPPEPGPTEATVAARYSLISSGTELSYYQGNNQKLVDGVRSYPVMPGYSMVGQVIAIGDEVADLVVGDTVFAAAAHASAQNVASSACVRIPDENPTRYTAANIASVAASAPSAMRAVNAVGPVAIFGLGLVGNVCAQILNHDFATTGYSSLVGRVNTLARCGVRALSASEVSASEGSGAEAFNTIVEAAGTPRSVAAAFDAVAPGGCVVMLGSPREPMTIDLYRSIHERGVTVVGAHANRRNLFDGRMGKSRSLRQSLAWAAELIECQRILVDPLISRVMDFTEVAHAYHLLMESPDQVTAIVIDWTRLHG